MRVDISDTHRDEEEYRGLNGSPEPVSDVLLDSLLDQNLLCAKTQDSAELLEELLSATWVLVERIGCTVPVSKKGYVDLLQQLIREMKEACLKS